MQYNIFKIINIDSLIDELSLKGYEEVEQTINSGVFLLKLFYREISAKELPWAGVFKEFGENNIPKKSGAYGVILCLSDNNNYAITFGSSSFIVQKHCDYEFGFDFVKRIDLKELKRKSSATPSSSKNSSVITFKNTNNYFFESGENITSLSFTPEDEFYGNRIDIGKSIKMKAVVPLVEIEKLLNKIEEDITKEVKYNIPIMKRVTDLEEIELYDNEMYKILNDTKNSKDAQQLLADNQFSIVGSSIYVADSTDKILKVGRNTSDNVDISNLSELHDLAKEWQIDLKEIIEKGEFVFNSQSGVSIREPIKKYLSFTFDNKNVTLYNGEWHFYNNDYTNLVINQIMEIDVEYNKDDDYTHKQVMKNKLDDTDYKEKILNRMLCEKYNGKLLDRDNFIIHYENQYFKSSYRVEIADLIINKEYISLKIGRPQIFNYCIDQSSSAAMLVHHNVVNLSEKNLEAPEVYTLWLYFTSFTIFDGEEAHLERLPSIILLAKICEWVKVIRSYGKKPYIRVNKYIK